MKALIYKAHPDAVIPQQKSTAAAGLDLHCLEDFSISSGQRLTMSTGLVVQPPSGYHIEILARSGLAHKYGITITNAVGLIDHDFCGENDIINIMLYMVPTAGKENAVASFTKGDRIAQLVFRKTEMFEFQVVDEAPSTLSRGGLGSTGVR